MATTNKLFNFYVFQDLPEGTVFRKKPGQKPGALEYNYRFEKTETLLGTKISKIIADNADDTAKAAEQIKKLLGEKRKTIAYAIEHPDKRFIAFNHFVFSDEKNTAKQVADAANESFKPELKKYTASPAFILFHNQLLDAMIMKLFVPQLFDQPLLHYLKSVLILLAIEKSELTDKELKYYKSVRFMLPKDLSDFYNRIKSEASAAANKASAGEHPLVQRRKELESTISHLRALDTEISAKEIDKLIKAKKPKEAAEFSLSGKTLAAAYKAKFKADLPTLLNPDLSGISSKELITKAGLELESVLYKINSPATAVKRSYHANGIIISENTFDLAKDMILDMDVMSQFMNMYEDYRNSRIRKGPKCLGRGAFYYTEENTVKYLAGELAHIENILPGEHKKREHVWEHTTDTFVENLEQEVISSEKDLTTNNQFELKNAVKEEVSRDIKWGVNADTHFRYGTTGNQPMFEVNAAGHYDFQKQTKKQVESSSMIAKSIVEKSVEKIEKTVSEKRSKRIIDKVVETNIHEINNVQPESKAISGIYQWVNKIVKVNLYQIENRMQYEFILPEPSAFYLYSLNQKPGLFTLSEPLPPKGIVDYGGGRISAVDLLPELINEMNYSSLCASYQVSGVEAPPQEFIYMTFNKSGEGDSSTVDNNEVKMKTILLNEAIESQTDGYIYSDYEGWLEFENKHVRAAMDKIKYKISEKAVGILNDIIADSFAINIGSDSIEHGDEAQISRAFRSVISYANIKEGKYLTDVADDMLNIGENLLRITFKRKTPFEKAEEKMVVSMVLKYAVFYNLTVTFRLKRSKALMKQWQQKIYDKIMTAYYELKYDFEEKKARFESQNAIQQGISIEGNNPLTNVEIVSNEIKRQCIYTMRQDHFLFNDVMSTEGELFADHREASKAFPLFSLENNKDKKNTVLFWEQAFEWHYMMLKFMPYYWADKTNWISRMQASSNDPAMQEFLQAGAVRVVVPVRPGYEEMVQYAIETGSVWSGSGETPTLGDERFLEVYKAVKEERKIAEGSQELCAIDCWEVVIPTNLVILRDNAHLLPVLGTSCEEDCAKRKACCEKRKAECEALKAAGEDVDCESIICKSCQ